MCKNQGNLVSQWTGDVFGPGRPTRYNSRDPNGATFEPRRPFPSCLVAPRGTQRVAVWSRRERRSNRFTGLEAMVVALLLRI